MHNNKILFLAFDYPPNGGGVAEYNRGVVEALVGAGAEVWVIAPRVSVDTEEADMIATKTIRVGDLDANKQKYNLWKRTLTTWNAARELRSTVEAAAKEFSPDYALVSPVSVWADTVRNAGIPYGICVHGADALGKRADWARTVYRRIAVRRILRRAEAVFVNSDFTKNALRRASLDHEKTLTTYCGVSRSLIDLADSLGSCHDGRADVSKMLTMSRLVPFKACDVLIEAVGILHEEYPDLMLTVAGDGPEMSMLEAKVNAKKLQNVIRFVGYVEGASSKAALFHEHGLFVQAGREDPKSARVENFGIVFAEAGTFCRASIGPRIGGVPEVIEEGITGLLMEPDDAKSLANCIRIIHDQPGMAVDMGAAARRRVDRFFNYDSIALSIRDKMAPYASDGN